MVVLAEAENLITLFVGLELLSIPLYVLCATELRRAHLARGGAQVPGDRLGRLGDAAVRAGADLRRHRRDATSRASRPRSATTVGAHRPAAAHRHRAVAPPGLAFKASVAPFHQWTPDVYQGAPTPDHHVHGGGHQGGRVRDLPAPVRPRARPARSSTGRPALAALAAVDDRDRQRRARSPQRSLKRLLAWSSVAQAGYLLAGVVVGTELGPAGHRLLPGRLPADERGGVRRGDRARARVRARRRPRVAREPRPRAALARLADDDRDALAGRLPGHRRLHRASSI